MTRPLCILSGGNLERSRPGCPVKHQSLVLGVLQGLRQRAEIALEIRRQDKVHPSGRPESSKGIYPNKEEYP